LRWDWLVHRPVRIMITALLLRRLRWSRWVQYFITTIITTTTINISDTITGIGPVIAVVTVGITIRKEITTVMVETITLREISMATEETTSRREVTMGIVASISRKDIFPAVIKLP